MNGSNNLKVEKEYSWPSNLYIVGTVNIDETTYMFSPKVLDRANVIEFRVSEEEMKNYLSEPKEIIELNGEGASMGEVSYPLLKIKKNLIPNFYKIH